MQKVPTIYAIPVRPQVRQFLLLFFGQEQPHALHQNTFLGRLVRMKLEKQPFRQGSRPPRPEGPAFELTLPTALRHSTLTPEAARQLGDLLDRWFPQQMISFVLGHVAAGGNEREALRKFCKAYNIDPSDADLETLRKNYRDYKDKVLRDNGLADLFCTPAGREELRRDYALAS